MIFLTVTDMYYNTLELGVFMYEFHGLPMAFSNFFKKRANVHDTTIQQNK